MNRFLSKCTITLLDLLYPRTCRLCRDTFPEGGDLCADCQNDLDRLVLQSYCPRCTADIGPLLPIDGRCANCRTIPLIFDGAVRVAPYTGPMTAMILQFKYAFRHDLDHFLGGLLGDAIRGAPWYDQINVVTSVPAHWSRQIRGHFHAADPLADIAAKRADLPRARLVRRIRAGVPQVGLPKDQREANVKNAFAMAPRTTIEGATICVVDDVMTTGATMREVSRVLQRAGAEAVYAAILAKATHRTELPPAL